MLRIYCVLLLLGASPAMATSLYKCIDSNGHVTFTQQACQDGSGGKEMEVKSSSKGMLIADPNQIPPPAESAARRNYNQCGDLTQVDIRSLVGNRQIQVGMTAEDAAESWGRPSKINSSSYGNDQWVYSRANGDSQYIYVDGNGCVTAWN